MFSSSKLFEQPSGTCKLSYPPQIQLVQSHPYRPLCSAFDFSLLRYQFRLIHSLFLERFIYLNCEAHVWCLNIPNEFMLKKSTALQIGGSRVPLQKLLLHGEWATLSSRQIGISLRGAAIRFVPFSDWYELTECCFCVART